ncbi:unnamed protein product [Cylicocyclus nassatus]|uniref:Uncharacterized protein n=1 Tax=Cylicocyclus nassatus TaxID=53992 RepID=A0AA36GTY7_CYLNA|nr:unnamed protein product [Cylicocyclus nassatus]
MSVDQLRKNVIDELRKAEGEPLSLQELFERCGGAKATNLNLEAFRHFIMERCSRAVKPVHGSDENSLPKYALHVDHARKTGTLKKRTARSKSQSSSRGGTPDGGTPRFNPRTEGFIIFCHIVRRLSAISQDGSVNWNAIRNQYRKETGRQLVADELNNMCGTINMTKNELLTTYLSPVVEVLDSRGQIIRPTTSFISNSKTPSPIALQPLPKDRELSPMVSIVSEEVQSDLIGDGDQNIVEQLRKDEVDNDDSKTSSGERTPPTSRSSASAVDEASKPSSREMFRTPDSGHTSFVSVNQTFETSGEFDYVTGDDRSPESDISLDVTCERSALNSTPCRTHEITLCDDNDPVVQSETEYTEHKDPTDKDVLAQSEQAEHEDKPSPVDSFEEAEDKEEVAEEPVEQVPHEDERRYEVPSESGSDHVEDSGELLSEEPAEVEPQEKVQEDERPYGVPSESGGDDIEDSADLLSEEAAEVIIQELAQDMPTEEGLPTEGNPVPEIVITEPEEEAIKKDVEVEEKLDVDETNEAVNEDLEVLPDVESITELEDVPSEDSEDADAQTIVNVVVEEPDDLRSEELYSMADTISNDLGEEYIVDEQKVLKSAMSDPNIEESAEESDTYIPQGTPVKERRLVFEASEEKEEPELPSVEIEMDADVDVKEKVEMFEHLRREQADGKVNLLDEDDHPEKGDAAELVSDLEHSSSGEEPFVEEEVTMPPHSHVSETVDKLENELEKKSLLVCKDCTDVFEQAVEEVKAGDHEAVEEIEESNEMKVIEKVTSWVELNQEAPALNEMVTVTIEPSEPVAQAVAKICDKDNSLVTSTVVVDVIPHKEHGPKLTASESWEKAFVVASGSVLPKSASSQKTSVDLDVSEAHSVLHEMEKLEEKAKTEVTTPVVKEANGMVKDENKVTDLTLTKELPPLPAVIIKEENTEAILQLTKKRGQALAQQRRLMDCCTVL